MSFSLGNILASYYNYNNYNNIYTRNNINRSNFSNYSNTNSIKRTSNSSYQLYNSSNASFLSTYTSSMCNLKVYSQRLETSASNTDMQKYAYTSSDTDILESTSFFRPQASDKYEINVSQIATQQKNSTDFIEKNGMSFNSNISLSINTNDETNAFNVDTTGKTNEEVLKEINAKINKSDMGVYSEIVEKDNKISLNIISNKTGEKENFNVSASKQLSDINITNTKTKAQDAIVSVVKNGDVSKTQNIKSSTNFIDIDSYKVTAELKSAGKATIEPKINGSEIISNAKSFVGYYNKTRDFLKDNIDKGSAIERHLTNLDIPSYDIRELNSIGISKDANDNLVLDEKALNKAINDDTDKVKNILGSSSGIISKVSNTASKALKEPSVNLINGNYFTTNSSSTSGFINSNAYYSMLKAFGTYNSTGEMGMYSFNNIGSFLNLLV